MQPDNEGTGFTIWGADRKPYGPVELPTLVSWIKDHRVTSDTWVYRETDQTWHKAAEVPELRMFYSSATPGPTAAKAGAGVSERTAILSVQPSSLRRVKVLAEFTDPQLVRFANFMEVVRARQFEIVVRQNEHGDAMFMLLEGELRVRMMIEGKESTLVTLSPGDFFGEVSLFDHGPRSADVVANQDSKMLKITTRAFEELLRQAPDLAAPFLFSMSKTLTARIRADNKRFRDAINFARTAGR